MQSSPTSYGDASAPRLATFFHALILLSSVICGTLAATVIGPILPAMQQHFRDVPGIGTWVPIVVTLPMLVLGILAVPIGWIADRVGRKRVLAVALVLYAIAGTAPLYLDSLFSILASRALVGVAEAAAMTCSTTLIGDYFSGHLRDRYVSLQTTFASVSALAFNLLGGTLGMHGWRMPFAVYALTLVIAPLVLLFIWEPVRHDARTRAERHASQTETPFNAWLLALICVVAFFCGVIFLMVPIHFAFMLVEVGTVSPPAIGVAYAINSLCVVAGTLVFGWFVAKRFGVLNQLVLAALVSGVGFTVMGHAHDYSSLLAGGAINGIGCGLLLPASVAWALRLVPAERRGVGIGAYMASQSIGYFCNPLLIMPIVARTGSRFPAVGAWGLALLAFVGVALACSLRRRRATFV
ncbi:MFS transporter [Paraburkholderia fungorum]